MSPLCFPLATYLFYMPAPFKSNTDWCSDKGLILSIVFSVLLLAAVSTGVAHSPVEHVLNRVSADRLVLLTLFLAVVVGLLVALCRLDCGVAPRLLLAFFAVGVAANLASAIFLGGCVDFIKSGPFAFLWVFGGPGFFLSPGDLLIGAGQLFWPLLVAWEFYRLHRVPAPVREDYA